jgi:hypothetical protein
MAFLFLVRIDCLSEVVESSEGPFALGEQFSTTFRERPRPLPPKVVLSNSFWLFKGFFLAIRLFFRRK